MKYVIGLLIAVLFVVSAIFVQAVEHSYISRGITCELYFIQGQVETAKSLDLIIEKLDKDKKKENISKYVKAIQHYQLFVAQLDGIKNCTKIEQTTTEIVYMRFKQILAGKQKQ